MLISSFSGGRSSAYMCKLLLDTYDRKNLKFIFMNTGVEHPSTLEFVNECDKRWNLNLVWLESVTHHNLRKASTHNIVNFESATRNESLFIDMVKKYGIPNVSYLHCTRELKINPFNSYIKSLQINNYKTAIGIRYDELDRIPIDYINKGFIYPLADNKITKEDVSIFWSKQEFNLKLSHQLGNCTFCYKKSPKRILENLNNIPNLYNQIKNIERSCGKGQRKMFRNHMSIDNLIKFVNTANRKEIEKTGYCSDNCELF